MCKALTLNIIQSKKLPVRSSEISCVSIGDQEILLKEDESTYILLGTMHRLGNPGKISLELVEVQSGSYFGEDDIVRFDDVYRR